jgi:hypothetical protein
MIQPPLYHSSCPAPQDETAALGYLSSAEVNLTHVHGALSTAIGRLNAIADAAFGAVPIGLETATKHGATAGACGKMLDRISDLQTALPALETAIERFATLA